MFGVQEKPLIAQFVGPIDDQLVLMKRSSLWGCILQRDDESTFISVGNRKAFQKHFDNLKLDPVTMFVGMVHDSGNVLALELLDRVVDEEECFMLNDEQFTWKDIRRADGDLGGDGSLLEDDDDDD